MKLYQATDQMATVHTWIEEHEEEIRAGGGELPPALLELLELAEGQFAEKAERVALYILHLEGEAEVIKAERDRLAARASTRQHAADGLRDYLKACLTAAGQRTVERTLVTVAIQNSPPSVQFSGDLNDEAVRAPLGELVTAKTLYALDKKGVLALHKAGYPLPTGTSVVIHTHLRIR